MFAVGIGTGVECQRPALQSLGRKEPYRANKDAGERPVPGTVRLPGLSGTGPDRCAPSLLRQTSDAAIAEQGIRYLTICCVLSQGMFMRVMNEKLLARHQPHHPEHDRPAGGCRRQHHP